MSRIEDIFFVFDEGRWSEETNKKIVTAPPALHAPRTLVERALWTCGFLDFEKEKRDRFLFFYIDGIDIIRIFGRIFFGCIPTHHLAVHHLSPSDRIFPYQQLGNTLLQYYVIAFAVRKKTNNPAVSTTTHLSPSSSFASFTVIPLGTVFVFLVVMFFVVASAIPGPFEVLH
jgi:hypothetical protein